MVRILPVALTLALTLGTFLSPEARADTRRVPPYDEGFTCYAVGDAFLMACASDLLAENGILVGGGAVFGLNFGAGKFATYAAVDVPSSSGLLSTSTLVRFESWVVALGSAAVCLEISTDADLPPLAQSCLTADLLGVGDDPRNMSVQAPLTSQAASIRVSLRAIPPPFGAGSAVVSVLEISYSVTS